jgi:hypothetical protein
MTKWIVMSCLVASACVEGDFLDEHELSSESTSGYTLNVLVRELGELGTACRGTDCLSVDRRRAVRAGETIATGAPVYGCHGPATAVTACSKLAAWPPSQPLVCTTWLSCSTMFITACKPETFRCNPPSGGGDILCRCDE